MTGSTDRAVGSVAGIHIPWNQANQAYSSPETFAMAP